MQGSVHSATLHVTLKENAHWDLQLRGECTRRRGYRTPTGDSGAGGRGGGAAPEEGPVATDHVQVLPYRSEAEAGGAPGSQRVEKGRARSCGRGAETSVCRQAAGGWPLPPPGQHRPVSPGTSDLWVQCLIDNEH